MQDQVYPVGEHLHLCLIEVDFRHRGFSDVSLDLGILIDSVARRDGDIIYLCKLVILHEILYDPFGP